MGLTVSLRAHFKSATVDTASIAAAVAEVRAAGVAEKNLAPLVKAYAAANVEGRVPPTSRQAFEAALIGLINDLPKVPSSVLVRRGEADLTASIAQVQTTIGAQTTRIGTLETEVQALSTSLTTKQAEATSLLSTQATLQESLKTAKSNEQNGLLLTMFAAMLGGGGAVAKTVVTVKGVQTVLSVAEINTKLAELERSIAQTQSTSTQLQKRIVQVNAVVTEQRVALDGLKVFETSLRAAVAALPAATTPTTPTTPTTTTTPTPTTTTTTLSARLNALAISLEAHQALSKNLGQQIAVLETMKAGLTTANAELDGLIDTLQAANDGLTTQIATTQRAVNSLLVDLAIAGSHLPAHIDIGALSLSTKALLLDGVDGLRLEVYAQARATADMLLTTGLLGVPPESAAGRLFLAALGNDRAAAEAAARSIAIGPLNVDSFTGKMMSKALDEALASGSPEQRHFAEQMLLTSRKGDSDMALEFRALWVSDAIAFPQYVDLQRRLDTWKSDGLTVRDLPRR